MTEGHASSAGRRWLGCFLRSAAAGLLTHLLLTTVAWAQDGTLQPGVGQTGIAMLRSLQEMQVSEAAQPVLPMPMPPSLPTMDLASYLALKLAAGVRAGDVKPEAGGETLPAAPPTLGTLHCRGIGQNAPVAGGSVPPDTHGAVGANHFGQVVNQAIRFYSKALTGDCPTAMPINVSLASFFGYSNERIFDPRLLYDLTYRRWIVSAEAFPESSTIQQQFIAVSLDSDPTHGFFHYRFNVRDWVGANVFWDYPQIGYDEDAIILTANTFNPAYLGSTVVFFSKHRMYAGLSFSHCWFNGSEFAVGTLTPTNVLDQGPYTTMAAVALGANFIRVYKWNNTARVCPNLLSASDIVTPTTVPPLAPQPSFPSCSVDATYCLGTLDGRFQSQGTQVGTTVANGGSPVRFWQTRAHGSNGFSVPRTYRINADTLTIEELCAFSLSPTSFDFNPSIVANEDGTLFLTWSATDPSNRVNVQVRMGGKLFGDACSVIGSGSLVTQSSAPLTGNFDPAMGFQRWGDYSAITLDPNNHAKAYGVNEKVKADTGPTTWRSYLFNMRNP